MRRRQVPGPGVDEALVRFVPGEWPARDYDGSFRLWCEARLAYARQYPDSEIGDALDVLGVHADMQRRWATTGRPIA